MFNLNSISSPLNRIQNRYFQLRNKQFLYEWHADVLEDFVRVLKPRVYVELGVYQCTTFNRIQKFCSSSFAIDIDKSAADFVRGKRSTFIHGGSDVASDFFRSSNLTIDFLFIDGDHQSEAVKRDLVNLIPLMSSTGIVILHDTWPKNEHYASDGYCSDSFRIPTEINRGTFGNWAAVSIPIHPGLTICTRSDQLPDWAS